MWSLVDSWSAEQPSSRRYRRNGELPAQVMTALQPTLSRHLIPAARSPQFGPNVVWCSSTVDVQVIDQHIDVRSDDSGAQFVGCTDLWVELNPDAETISASFEGHDLARHVADTDLTWASFSPVSIPLADDLAGSLEMVADLLDDFCSQIVVIPSNGGGDVRH